MEAAAECVLRAGVALGATNISVSSYIHMMAGGVCISCNIVLFF